MQEVVALPPDSLMALGYVQPLFLPVVRAMLLSGERPLFDFVVKFLTDADYTYEWLSDDGTVSQASSLAYDLLLKYRGLAPAN